MAITADFANSSGGLEAVGRSWMVLRLQGSDWAVASDLVSEVYRTADARRVSLSDPKVDIEVHGGRPWFIVSPRQVFQMVDESPLSSPREWTVAFSEPAGVAIHAEAVEGPYRGVLMEETLKTSQGSWPVLRLLAE